MLGFWPFLTFGASIFFLVFHLKKEVILPVPAQVIFSLCWLPYIYLHLSYYIKNKGAKVSIDQNNHRLTYIQGSKNITFHRDDIDTCQINFTKHNSRANWDSYSYVWFILKDNRRLVITSMMGEPEDIVNAIGCKYEISERSFPHLPF